MEIWHQINLSSSYRQDINILSAVEKLGITGKKTSGPGGTSHLFTLKIKESDPIWESLENILRSEGYSGGFTYTTFDQKEILSAEWLRVLANEIAYPEPNSYPAKPNNMVDVCPNKHCRCHAQQISPYIIRREPKIGNSTFAGLHWTVCLLISTTAIESFISQGFLGHRLLPVLVGNKSRKESLVVKQIVTTNETSGGLIEVRPNKSSICNICNTYKHNYISVGMMHYQKVALPKNLDFVMTKEWFGDGAFAFRELFITQRVVRWIIDNGYKGLNLQPIKLL